LNRFFFARQPIALRTVLYLPGMDALTCFAPNCAALFKAGCIALYGTLLVSNFNAATIDVMPETGGAFLMLSASCIETQRCRLPDPR
jgi:hypothetical protein